MKPVNFVGRLGTAGILLSGLSLLSYHHLIFDLLSSFRLQYVFGGSLVLLLLLVTKSFTSAFLVVVVLTLHGIEIVKSQYPQRQFSQNSNTALRVMSSNLLASNSAHAETIKQINAVSPDVIVFQEYTPTWHNSLSTLSGIYRYRIVKPLSSPFGIAMYSKLPLQEATTSPIDKMTQGINATVTLGAKTIRVLGVHTTPPISNSLYQRRNTHLTRLANYANSVTEPLLIMGDLNTTPWSSHFQRFIEDGMLYDGRRGFGIKSTWPGALLPLQIPIDHIIVNDSIDVLALDTVSITGSDHKSLWADIQLQ